MVDVGGFDGIYLLFYRRDLRGGLFEGVFVLLLPSKGCLGSCWRSMPSASDMIFALFPDERTAEWDAHVFLRLLEGGEDIPVLFTVTFFLASASCSAIWFSKCLSRFCSISSCCRRPKMASLGASLRFCAPLPPNQPHILRFRGMR